MTEYRAQSIRRAIADCDRYIAKEGARAADLRPPEVAKLLAWYIQHRAKLRAELEAWATTWNAATARTRIEQMDGTLYCPSCDSTEAAVTAEQMFMVNTGDHYRHSVKAQDDDAMATCLACLWTGTRGQLAPAT